MATVAAILEAASRILIRHGYEGATTARIAEKAGVSVGSLYQYFPNKESIVAALVVRYADDATSRIEKALRYQGREGLKSGLSAFIQAGVDAHRIDPTLHKILTEQVPRVGQLAKVMDTGHHIALMLEEFLIGHRTELRAGLEPRTAALVVETVIEALGHKAVLEKPSRLNGVRMEREMFDVVWRYLT